MYTKLKCLVKVLVIVVLIMGALLIRKGVSQEHYPNRPVTVIYGFSPGGMGHTLVTALCKAAEKELGQPIIVELKVGASGTIATRECLMSKPDGYTLGMAFTSSYLILPNIRNLPYNPIKDSIIISVFFTYNFGFAVKSDAPWNTFEEVIEYARKNPGKFKYGTPGIGMPQHIALERVAMKEGIKWTHIPFKSPAESVVACLGGHIDAAPQGSVDIISHLKAGKLKLLLVLDDKRWPAFPNVPTILEKGYNFYAMSNGLIIGPKGIPGPIEKRLEDVFEKAKKDPSFINTLEKFQVEPSTISGQKYLDKVKSEFDEMGRIVKAIGISEK